MRHKGPGAEPNDGKRGEGELRSCRRLVRVQACGLINRSTGFAIEAWMLRNVPARIALPVSTVACCRD